MEIRQSYNRLISTMGFPVLVRWHLYIESGPWFKLEAVMQWSFSMKTTSKDDGLKYKGGLSQRVKLT